ncbi:MAG: hypothetical protein KDJ55_09405 [Rhodobiaceae bacterium]|nr:hypothetical protein [Rhodobiaceae bacterium]MCC0012291.1 hypothetical protein [Rhodobiaceae bacterium]MCC0060794.1 hypothetical protein [Rhodobiaceae bacterium]
MQAIRSFLFLAIAFCGLCIAMPGSAIAQSNNAAEETVRAVEQILKGVITSGGDQPADAEPGTAAESADGKPTAEGQTPAANVPAADPDAPPVPGRLYARLTEDAGALSSGVHWRLYRTTPEADGSFMTVASSDEPQPVINVAPGEYVAVAVFGHAVASRKITVEQEPFREAITLNAGGLRLTSLGFDGKALSPKVAKLSVYSAEQDEFGQRKLVVENAQPGRVIVLNAGSYHIVSQYGDANSVVRDDVKVEAAQLTDARIKHSAAAITFKLVNEAGGEALANTAWSIVSPGGDVVKESFGAFPTHILAAGDYSVIARHENNIYNRDFSVQPGLTQEVEVVAQ